MEDIMKEIDVVQEAWEEVYQHIEEAFGILDDDQIDEYYEEYMEQEEKNGK